jgi:hypothetical protein
MYGPIGDLGPIWDSLPPLMSPTHVLGVVLLGLFLVLHVVVVRLVVRPRTGSGRVVASRDNRIRQPVVGESEVNFPYTKVRGSPLRNPDLVLPNGRTPHPGNAPVRDTKLQSAAGR